MKSAKEDEGYQKASDLLRRMIEKFQEVSLEMRLLREEDLY
jgi:hypothetical protein